MSIDSETLRRARNVAGLTTTQAGQLVHVVRRTWELWESGKSPMPSAKAELFISKLTGSYERSPESGLVVIIGKNGNAIDVVAEHNYLHCKQVDCDTYEVASLALNPLDQGRPCVHKTIFLGNRNKGKAEKLMSWTSNLDK